MNRKNSFDLIRLIASTAVLLSHSFPLSGFAAAEPISAHTRYGSAGEIAVDVFFVISGYLIAGSYQRSAGAIDFLSKRFLRLFPALICAILLSVFVLGPIVTPLSLSQYFAHPQTLGYLHNLFLDIRYPLPLVFASNPIPNVVNGSLWTLPLEAFMYLLVMLAGVARLLHFRGCFLVAVVFAWLHFAVPSTVFTDNGVVLHVMLYNELTRLGILYFIGSTFAFSSESWLRSKEALWLSIATFVLFAHSSVAEIVAIATLPVITLTLASLHNRLSDSITRVGDLSYGVYVYAFPVQQTAVLILGHHASPITVALASLPTTLLFSFVSWHVVENPALRLKNRLFRSNKQNTLAKSG